MFRFWIRILLFLANVEAVAFFDVYLPKRVVDCEWDCGVKTTSKEVSSRVQLGAKFKVDKLVDQKCADNRTVNSSTFVDVQIMLMNNNRNPNFLSFVFVFFSERELPYKEHEPDNNSYVSCVLRPTSNTSTKITIKGLEALQSPLFYIMDNASYIANTRFMGFVNVEGNIYFSAGLTDAGMTPEYSLKFDHWGFVAVTVLSYFFLIVFSLYSPYMLTLFCPAVKTVRIEHLSHTAKVHGTEESLLPEFPGLNIGLDRDSTQDFAECIYNEPSEMVLCGDTCNQGPSLEFLAQSHSGVDKGHGSYSTIEECPVIDTSFSYLNDNYIVVGKEQMGVQHCLAKCKSVHVQVIDVGGAASPVGLRNFIANKVFLNSTLLSPVKFIIMLLFPIFIPMWLDIFVLFMPGSFSRISTSLPSAFLTESVYFFMTRKYPILFLSFCFYVTRSFFLCLPYSPNWVPSFLGRKHLECFICNHYLMQLVFPGNSWTACNECKETPDCPKNCEIHVNVKHNHGYGLLQIFKKNRVDVFENLYPRYKQWLLQGNEGENSCLGKKLKIFLFLGSLGLGILYMLLIVLDFIVSLPITSLCYGRVWFTVNWFKSRYFQAIFLIIEFFVICFSIVGVAYFSFCCALSMKVAFTSVFLIGTKYPVEILLYLASHILVWHILWSCYSSFTNIYDDLVLKLFNACSENHASEFHQYKKGDAVYIPKKLFDSACDKLVPVKDSLKKLFIHLIVWVVGLFFVFSFIMAGSTAIPDSKVLGGTVTFLIVVHPSIWDFLLTRGKKKERKDAVLKEKVKDLVDEFFKGKLD